MQNIVPCQTLQRLTCILIGIATSFLLNEVDAQDWHEFRGPFGNGIASATNLPTKFGEQKNVAWKTADPGRGWSSPVLVDNQIWITTAIEKDASAAERESKMATAPIAGLTPFGQVVLQAICLDANSGSILAQRDLFTIENPPLIHSLNSFASPTSVIDGDYVYCNFGTLGSACLNRKTFEIEWKNNQFKFDHETGPGSSPIIWQDLMIFHCDGTDTQTIVALNKESGELAWERKRTGEMNDNGSYRKSFSTPVIVESQGSVLLISAAANWLYCYDPETGNELWKMPYGKLGFSCVPRPLCRDGVLYLCTGFMRSSLMAIKLNGRVEPTSENILWRYEKQVPTMPSPIIVDGLLFMVGDRGIATCLDVESGQQKWMLRLGGGFSSSPILADGKLFFGNQKGKVFVMKPGGKKQLLQTNQLDSAVMATPAAQGDRLFVRTKESIYCIRNQSQE